MTTKNDTRENRLQKLNEISITSNESRNMKIQIALNEEHIKRLEKSEDVNANYYVLKYRQENRDLFQKLRQVDKRIFIGTIDAGGVWGIQLVYMKANEKGIFYVYIENLPSGWAISQVINKPVLTIDGGMNWTVKASPVLWEAAKAVIDHTHIINSIKF